MSGPGSDDEIRRLEREVAAFDTPAARRALAVATCRARGHETVPGVEGRTVIRLLTERGEEEQEWGWTPCLRCAAQLDRALVSFTVNNTRRIVGEPHEVSRREDVRIATGAPLGRGPDGTWRVVPVAQAEAFASGAWPVLGPEALRPWR